MKKIILLLTILLLLFTGCKSSDPKDNESENTITNEQSNKNDESVTKEETESKTDEKKDEKEKQVFIDGTEEEIATRLFNTYVAGDYKSVLNNFNYDAAVKKQVNEQLLITLSQQIADFAGEFEEISSTNMVEQNNMSVVTIISKYSKSYLQFTTTFNQDKVIMGYNFVPARDPAEDEKPSDITEIPIEFGEEDYRLPGIITVPNGLDSYPVVILVHGSGANDMDETIGPNKPFRDIANALGSKGIAVLRYDKRNKAHVITDPEAFTVYEESIDDAVYAYNYIMNDDKIKASEVYILGHSLGGYLIPRIAKELPEANGYIVLAGAARPLEDLIAEQIPYLANLDGAVTEEEQKQIDYYQSVTDKIKSLDESSDYTIQDLGGASKTYWLDLKDYDPVSLAKEIVNPMLILQGSRDYQVTTEDFNLWKQGLESQKNATFKLYDGLNHLFMKGEGVPNPNEYAIPSNVDDAVINDMADWILK